MQEIWKDIKGFEGLYQISNYGNVKSLRRVVCKSDGVIQIRNERIMAKRENDDGYYIAKLNVDKKSYTFPIHRLVAQHFIDNPYNYPEVNHLDCDRKNNKVDNLEWCTHLDNVRYSKKLGHYKGLKGDQNPNYQNDTLKKKYANNPELSKIKNSRPREQNGRCVPVMMYDENGNAHSFKYIGEVADYLIKNDYSKSSVNVIRKNITSAIKNGNSYLGCKFEKI